MGPGVLIASRVLGVWRFAFVEANDLPLTMGEFLGAANFIAICVMAWIMLAQSGPTEVDGLPFLRDSIMCMLVTIFMVAVTWDNLITLTESISFFVLYVFYIALVLLPGRLCFRTAHARVMNSEVELVFEPQMGTGSFPEGGLISHKEWDLGPFHP